HVGHWLVVIGHWCVQSFGRILCFPDPEVAPKYADYVGKSSQKWKEYPLRSQKGLVTVWRPGS
ncbi:MAG: hypothetical protein J7M27_01395, partial [Candidatus Latescibacteria bacterium]|nr:hypothetical protein [Candidatus Latescibacterota bacterium]